MIIPIKFHSSAATTFSSITILQSLSTSSPTSSGMSFGRFSSSNLAKKSSGSKSGRSSSAASGSSAFRASNSALILSSKIYLASSAAFSRLVILSASLAWASVRSYLLDAIWARRILMSSVLVSTARSTHLNSAPTATE